ncbi:VacJ family lipoprotein [Sphingobium sp. EM0848]|uniref:MlaA family lipoprotein n=1 Tax=Sphingobium sp. EM0848 TaxID=2743473 RepID=UPI00159C1360|nr:VacJ family lipoprotein [Sphingobium sp. EM0848]
MILPLIAPVALMAAQVETPLPVEAAGSQPVLVVPPSSQAVVVPADAASSPVMTGAKDEIGADEVKVEKDPLEGFNRAMFGVHQTVDKAILRPVAMGYKKVVPKPIRSGARNAISNLSEPFIFVNFLLQGKPGKAVETFARFIVNSTLGIAGLFDIAKRKDFNLPHRANGFGTTLAIYGVKAGPYLFLPLIGPTTLRDVLGKPADDGLLPLAVGRPFSTWEYQLSTGLVGGLDMRAEADPELRALFGDAVDPYATLRSVYLQNRAAEIEEIRGRHARKKAGDLPELSEPLTDPVPSDAPELQDPMADPAVN